MFELRSILACRDLNCEIRSPHTAGVLTAFQQGEDSLNALHNLEVEAGQQHDATASAQQSLDLFTTRYEGGVDNYLQVITWQTALLQNQQNDIEIARRRYESSVLLIKALGGGWDASLLPKQL